MRSRNKEMEGGRNCGSEQVAKEKEVSDGKVDGWK